VYYGYIRYHTITHSKEHIMSGTLNVVEVKAGTEFDGYDVSYQVTVESGEFDGTSIYSSRFPDKAVIKAVVKTAEDPFLGFVVKVDPAVATAAGVRNLEQRVNAERFVAAKEMFGAEFDAAAAVEIIKTVQG
jgi:hypothetical protein